MKGDFLFAGAIFFLVVGLIAAMFLGYIVSSERSHECSWYVERNFAAKDVPFRCFNQIKEK